VGLNPRKINDSDRKGIQPIVILLAEERITLIPNYTKPLRFNKVFLLPTTRQGNNNVEHEQKQK